MVTRPQIGDVFIVPLGDHRSGVGQVVATYGRDAYFFAIFDRVLPLDEASELATQALTAPVLLLALSMDAKIQAGHWRVVAHEAVDPSIPLPAYKEAVGTAGSIEVVSYSGDQRRPATAIEAAALPNRKVVAPVRLERALRACLGLEPWLDAFDELRAEGRVTTADIFG
jgi:Immunity protein 26